MKVVITENFLKNTINIIKDILIGFNLKKIDSKGLLYDLKTIQKFLIKNGIDLKEYPIINEKPIGQGCFGKVWRIDGKDLVLKISFNDVQELNAAKKIYENQEKLNLKHFAKIHYIKELTYAPGSAIYIKELCYPLPKDKVVNFNHDYRYLLGIHKKGGNMKIDNLYYDQISDLILEMEKLKIDSLDIYGDNNVMQDKNGIIKVVDY